MTSCLVGGEGAGGGGGGEVRKRLFMHEKNVNVPSVFQHLKLP